MSFSCKTRQNRDLFNRTKSLSIFQPYGSGTTIDNSDMTTQNLFVFAVILELDSLLVSHLDLMKRFDCDMITCTKSRIFGHPEFDICNIFTSNIDMFISFFDCSGEDTFTAVTLDFAFPFLF